MLLKDKAIEKLWQRVDGDPVLLSLFDKGVELLRNGVNPNKVYSWFLNVEKMYINLPEPQPLGNWDIESKLRQDFKTFMDEYEIKLVASINRKSRFAFIDYYQQIAKNNSLHMSIGGDENYEVVVSGKKTPPNFFKELQNKDRVKIITNMVDFKRAFLSVIHSLKYEIS